jgi:hypothetical protein
MWAAQVTTAAEAAAWAARVQAGTAECYSPGVYWDLTVDPWPLHLDAALAVLCCPTAWLSHLTALEIWGLTTGSAPAVCLAGTPPQALARPAVRWMGEGSLGRWGVVAQGDGPAQLLLTNPCRTLLEMAHDPAWDPQTIEGIHTAVAEGVLTRGDLRAGAEEARALSGLDWAGGLERVLALAGVASVGRGR